MENVRLAAIAYSQEYPGHNYFQDWIEIHSVLGLTVEYGSAVAIASLVSKLCTHNEGIRKASFESHQENMSL